jgi:hypothetical protein
MKRRPIASLLVANLVVSARAAAEKIRTAIPQAKLTFDPDRRRQRVFSRRRADNETVVSGQEAKKESEAGQRRTAR